MQSDSCRLVHGIGSSELLLRKAYVNHLEDLTLQKDDEKDVMHKQVMQQVTGVYKLHENEVDACIHARA